jgi:glutathione S-transferase
MLTLYARDGWGSVLVEARAALACVNPLAQTPTLVLPGGKVMTETAAIDLFIAVMTRWRPGRSWFVENTGRLHAIACALDAEPRLIPAWHRNFGKDA